MGSQKVLRLTFLVFILKLYLVETTSKYRLIKLYHKIQNVWDFAKFLSPFKNNVIY